MTGSSVHSSPAEQKIRRSHSERREEAEERMLQAAVKIVAERGLENLTLAECGEAAGYSRGLAAHYFDSKDGLITAIATHIVEDYSHRLRADGRNRIGLPGLLEGIIYYFESGRTHQLALRAFHAVLGAALNHPTLSKGIAELNRNSVSSFSRQIRSGMDRGEIRRNIDADAQAALILAGLRGAMTQWLVDPEHIDLDIIKKEFIGNLRRTLAI